MWMTKKLYCKCSEPSTTRSPSTTGSSVTPLRWVHGYNIRANVGLSRSTLAELATGKKLIFGDGYRTKRSEHGQPGLPILRVQR